MSLIFFLLSTCRNEGRITLKKLLIMMMICFINGHIKLLTRELKLPRETTVFCLFGLYFFLICLSVYFFWMGFLFIFYFLEGSCVLINLEVKFVRMKKFVYINCWGVYINCYGTLSVDHSLKDETKFCWWLRSVVPRF